MKKAMLLIAVVGFLFTGCASQEKIEPLTSVIEEPKEEVKEEIKENAINYEIKNAEYKQLNFTIKYPELIFEDEEIPAQLINDNILAGAINFGVQYDVADSVFTASYVRTDFFGSAISTVFYSENKNANVANSFLKTFFSVNVNLETGAVFSNSELIDINEVVRRIKEDDGFEVFDMYSLYIDADNENLKLLECQKEYLMGLGESELIELIELSYIDFTNITAGSGVNLIMPVHNSVGGTIYIRLFM